MGLRDDGGVGTDPADLGRAANRGLRIFVVRCMFGGERRLEYADGFGW